MKQIIYSREGYDKYNDLLQTVILQLNEYTNGERVEFGEQGFEDMNGVDIRGIDDESIYVNEGNDDETYPLHELDLMDALKILGDFEGGIYKK